MIATAIARNRPTMLYAWRGSSSLVLANDGTTGDQPLAGFFFRQTRYLSRLAFLIDGAQPHLCSAAQIASDALEFSYTFPPVDTELAAQPGGGSGSGGVPSRYGLLTRSLDLMLRYRVHAGACDVELFLHNRWNDEASFELSWLLDADYAGVSDILGHHRLHHAEIGQAQVTGSTLELRYLHEQLPYRTRVIAKDGAAWRISERRLDTSLRLARGTRFVARLVIVADDFEESLSDEDRTRREAVVDQWIANATRVHAAAETPLLSIVNRSLDDLGALALQEGPEESWLYPGAGVPLYLNVWGRDALTTSWQAGAFDRCEMLRAVLAYLGPRQGQKEDPNTEEEPGRILNREESMPASRLGLLPFRRFFADFASPFMFIIGLGQFFAWTADVETLRRHWPTVLGILDWARTWGDRDGDGFLEYDKHSSHGPKHQGWKDSENAVVDEYGNQVEPPIAPAEIQGYYYAALQFASILSLFVRDRKTGRKLWAESRELKKRFNREFWMEDEGMVAFGLDSKKRPIRSVASNAGHCLTAGIVATERLPRLVDRLFRPDMFSGWGIRTLSSLNPAFNPIDYHLGSIWPVENGSILLGLRRYGFDARTIELARGLYDLAMLWPLGRTPECVGGYGRDEFGHPGAYPQANAPQAWNESIWVIVMQTLLGLQPAASFHLLGVDPILPEWLPEVTLENIRVGKGSATIRFWRDSRGRSHYRVLRRTGTLRIVRQSPINDLHAHWWNRILELRRR